MALRSRDFYMFGVVVCLNILDLLTTQIGLKSGASTEANVFLTQVGLDLWRMAVAKAALLLIILVLMVISDMLALQMDAGKRKLAENGRTVVLAVILVMYAAVVGNNINILI